jgi:hypothetical protein
MSETRKLAAILVADVVGYSRLAGADEDRTLARLRGLRSDLIDPAIAAHRGRIVKRTSDGSITEFRSAWTRCAAQSRFRPASPLPRLEPMPAIAQLAAASAPIALRSPRHRMTMSSKSGDNHAPPHTKPEAGGKTYGGRKTTTNRIGNRGGTARRAAEAAHAA